MAKLAINEIQDVQGLSASMEGAFTAFLVMAQKGGHPRKAPKDRCLGGWISRCRFAR